MNRHDCCIMPNRFTAAGEEAHSTNAHSTNNNDPCILVLYTGTAVFRVPQGEAHSTNAQSTILLFFTSQTHGKCCIMSNKHNYSSSVLLTFLFFSFLSFPFLSQCHICQNQCECEQADLFTHFERRYFYDTMYFRKTSFSLS